MRARCDRPVLGDALADRRQPEDLADLVVVDPDEGEVPRDDDAELPRRLHRPEGHLVGQGEDRRRRVRPRQQLERGLPPAVHGELAAGDERRVELDADGGEGGACTVDAPGRDVEVGGLLRLRAEDAEVPVSELEQVLDGHLPDVHVVDAHGRIDARVLPDGDDAQTPVAEVLHVLGGERDLGEDDPVDPAVQRLDRGDDVAARRCRRCGDDEQVVAAFGADGLGARDDVGEVPRVDHRDDDRHPVAASGSGP